MRRSITLLVSAAAAATLVGCGGDDGNGSVGPSTTGAEEPTATTEASATSETRAGTASQSGPSGYLDDLAANGYADYFASDQAAVVYAQSFCEDYNAGNTEAQDEVSEIVVTWCDDEALLSADAATISNE